MTRRTVSAPANDAMPGICGHAVLTPTQFHDVWNGGKRGPECTLAAAVLETAVADLLKYRHARTRHCQNIYWQAYQWVDSRDREWPFSFVSICDCLGLSPEALKARLLGRVATKAQAAAA